jgi:hypothetical protein
MQCCWHCFSSPAKAGPWIAPNYIEQVQASLRDSPPQKRTKAWIFRASASGIDSLRINILRIPKTGKPITNDFLVVRTDGAGNIKSGHFITIDKDTTQRAALKVVGG